VVSVRTEAAIQWDGDLSIFAFIASTQNAIAVFLEADDGLIIAEMISANGLWAWWTHLSANPFTGKVIGKAMLSNGAAAAAQVKIGVLYTATA
jgi:hypothetical protein